MKDELKTTTIKEALGFPEGTPIQRLTGTLTHIFARKEGAGDYTRQSGVIEDGQDKILFTVWNRPNIPEDYKGRTLIFRTGGGKKPSMTLKSDFKDATKRTLNVTKTCMVVTEEEDTDDIPYDFPKPEMTDGERRGDAGQLPPKNAPKASIAPKKAIQVNGVQEAKKRLMQYANLRELCNHAASYLNPEADPSLIKDVSSCFFIQAAREGLLDKMPNNKPLSDQKVRELVTPTDDLHEEEQVF